MKITLTTTQITFKTLHLIKSTQSNNTKNKNQKRKHKPGNSIQFTPLFLRQIQRLTPPFLLSCHIHNAYILLSRLDGLSTICLSLHSFRIQFSHPSRPDTSFTSIFRSLIYIIQVSTCNQNLYNSEI